MPLPLSSTVRRTRAPAERSYLWSDANRGYANRIYDESKEVATILRDYLKYERLREQEAHLSRALATPGGSGL